MAWRVREEVEGWGAPGCPLGGGDGGGTVAARAFSQHFFTELYRFSRPKGSSNG